MTIEDLMNPTRQEMTTMADELIDATQRAMDLRQELRGAKADLQSAQDRVDQIEREYNAAIVRLSEINDRMRVA